jgi:Protein of unknown function (DUF3987)
LTLPRHGKNGNGAGAPEPHSLSRLSLSELHEEISKTAELIDEAERHGSLSESLKTELHASRAEMFRELERRWAPLPLVEKQHGEPQEVEFPEAAWNEKIFGDFREVIVPYTEAAPEKLWSALLVAAGLMLGRNVWLENPKPIYGNFYTMLVGQTADARKSTVLWVAAELLRRVDEDVEILSGMVSTEGIFERLAKEKGTRALGYVDELRSLLAVARRKGTGDLLPKLNSLYYCPEREGIDRREKSTTIVEPFFSLMSATALGYVEDLLGNAEIVGGTLNRFLIIPGKEQEPKPFAEAPSKEAWSRITGPLGEIRDHWQKTPRRFDWHPEAKELWREFYIEWRRSRVDWDSTAASLTARVFEHVQKIALVYSAFSGKPNITPKALATAIAIGKWLQASTLSIFSDVGVDIFTRAENEILRVMAKRGFMYRRDLQRNLSRATETAICSAGRSKPSMQMVS